MTAGNTEENILENKINIAKFPMSTTKYYKLSPSQDWVKALLAELNEKAEDKSPEDYLKETKLELSLEIKKLFKREYGEYLLVKYSLETEYVTQCVRTLADMPDSLSLEGRSCFMDGVLENSEEFTEQLEIFEENEVHDLYYYQKGFADLAEMIHEQVYLNINQYPIKDADTPLAWGNQGSDTKQ